MRRAFCLKRAHPPFHRRSGPHVLSGAEKKAILRVLEQTSSSQAQRLRQLLLESRRLDCLRHRLEALRSCVRKLQSRKVVSLFRARMERWKNNGRKARYAAARSVSTAVRLYQKQLLPFSGTDGQVQRGSRAERLSKEKQYDVLKRVTLGEKANDPILHLGSFVRYTNPPEMTLSKGFSRERRYSPSHFACW